VTASPTQPLQDVLEQWIIRTDADRALFDDPTTAQSLALHWLSADSILRTDLQPREILERYVLAVFYFSTSGVDWVNRQALNS
jgi:hypothetical protein